MFGCSRNDALGAPVSRFMPERFRAAHAAHVEAFGRTGTTNRRMGDTTTLWAVRSDGREFPIEASISQTNVDGRHLYTVILRDVTRRKEAEDALHRSQQELRELSARVLQAREDEKTHIARELHDELGQSLTAMKMDLAWLRERLPADDAELASKAQGMNATLDATVAATRRISADLRPLMLDDLGLPDAAEWLIEEFSQRSGIQCRLDMDDADKLISLPGPVATALYRILQESLTNITRHAGANRVEIELRQRTDDNVNLTVQDDGRGITEADRAKPTSFGLRGIRERVHYLGGNVEIAPGQAGGTRLTVNIPLAKSAAR
ncbi:MAG: PAS domain S-box protein [Betaproteobacteria bacterium]|nr:PAS domain S-box protein [Betaproteobacteria bacterium]